MINLSESLPDKEKTKLEIMQGDFCGIFDEAKKSEAVELFEKIIKEYQNENRKHHNLEHIENFLDFLKERESEIKELRGMKLAVWFHDFVYDTEADNNEEQSAQRAKDYLEQLGVSEELIEYVMALIRATIKHEATQDNPDLMIFLDGDLAILGASEEVYDRYAANIRKEYAWMSDEEYRAGRIKVLEGFFKRPRIYLTDKANEKLEQQARRNMEREIKMLSA